MSFADGLRAGRFVVALEITPPQQARSAVLLRRARLLGSVADCVNVIQRQDRQASLDAALLLRRAGIQPVWHLANRGRGRAEIAADLMTAAAGGITQVLCLRGDHRAADRAGTPSIREVIRQTRAVLPAALIGATANQYAADQRAVLANLRAKVVAGAGYVQTQPVFDLTTLRPLAEMVRAASAETRIVPMVIPLLSTDAAERIATRLGIRLPDRLLARLGQGGQAAGWDLFDETLAGLAEATWADGIAIMTSEMDAPRAVGERLIMALAGAGIVRQPATLSEQ